MAPVDSLYTEYSKDVIRITECKRCGKEADKYVEYDAVLIFNDLFLQYVAAYRHLLLNTTTELKTFARLGMIFGLADAYHKWINRRATLPSDSLFDLEWTFYESLFQSCAETWAFLLVAHGLSRLILRKETDQKRLGFLFYCSRTVVGFFGNVFVVFSIIWHLNQHFSYRILTTLFTFVTHVQVQRTLCSSMKLPIVILVVFVSKLASWAVGIVTGVAIQEVSRLYNLR
uniref:Protein ARV n=1 Tax=Panagrellus redivivus TaxID=6233 RepID=A0A7E4VLW6_PANRE